MNKITGEYPTIIIPNDAVCSCANSIYQNCFKISTYWIFVNECPWCRKELICALPLLEVI